MSATVLIVDDSESIRQSIGDGLREAGFNVVTAINGVQGAEQIDGGGIDCVVCDLRMPIMNGIEMLRHVKKNPAHAKLPIFMLTTESSLELVNQAKDAGAMGWILKPAETNVVVAAVRKLTGVLS